ncbi:MAG TPA: hypothetical protein VNT60_01110, partial [Deinococcales bacterium]|nr:hypothetical protein [Deinococcales bacterium]
MRIRYPIAVLAVTAALAACTSPKVQDTATSAEPSVQALALKLGQSEHVAGELIVKYRPGASETEKARADSRAGVQRVETLRANRAEGDLHRARVLGGKALERAIADLQADPGVEYAEPNWIYQHDAAKDPYYT